MLAAGMAKELGFRAGRVSGRLDCDLKFNVTRGGLASAQIVSGCSDSEFEKKRGERGVRGGMSLHEGECTGEPE